MPEQKQTDDLETKGRMLSFIKLFAIIGITSAIGELIGKITIDIKVGSIIILPMVFSMIIAVFITPDAIGKKIPFLKKYVIKKKLNLLIQ